MATTVSETDKLKIIRFYGGEARGRTYSFIDVKTGREIQIPERDLLHQIERDNRV